MTGKTVAHYELKESLGAGGMGEVYRAKDTKLGRDVAVKLLPETFANDAERVARFEREAKVLAALNHPNIASIYGFEGGALIMELVKGKSPKGPMSFDSALHIGSQIAAALEYAHDRGIVHRDLKPANIKITADGTVKLLDFGLAKAFSEPSIPSTTDLSNSPTLTMATEVGLILGTAAYMAPEQAKGRNVDKRADIWAFGVVFYEFLTGRQLFHGEDVSATLAQVLTKQPDLEHVPERARRLLQACLEKDPKRRLRDIGDANRLLEDAKPQIQNLGKRYVFWKLAAASFAALSLAAASVALIHFRETPVASPILSSTVLPPENTTFYYSIANSPGLFTISPDGKKLVVSARSSDGKIQLWIRPLDSLTAQPLSGTDGATFPFWAPDSRWLGFFADGKLKKIDTSGGPPVPLADAPVGRGGTWSKDNVIVFSPSNNDPLHMISAAGGSAKPVTKLGTDEGPHRLPWFLPDGKHFLYRVQGSTSAAIRIGSLDNLDPSVIGPATSNAVYSNGYLLFRRESTLMAQPFDERRLVITGEALPVAENVNVVLSAGFFSVSETGLLVYQRGTPLPESDRELTLMWIDRTGKPLEKLSDGLLGDIGDIQFSPDRMKFAYTKWGSTSGDRDIWIYDISRQLASRFTLDPSIERNPVWSPDGHSIAFFSIKDDRRVLNRKPTDVPGTEEALWADKSNEKTPTSWSRDGEFLLVNGYSPSGKAGSHVWKLQLNTKRPSDPGMPSAFLDTGSFDEVDGQFSPDGKWVAYCSNESKKYEIYLTGFPTPGNKRQISIAGGTRPRWRPDGKEIFYVDLTARLMAAEVIQKGAILEIGQVRPVVGGIINSRGYLYDVSQDGTRFLTRILPGALLDEAARRGNLSNVSQPLTLISNWPALLKN